MLFYAVSNIADPKADPDAKGSGRRLVETLYNDVHELPVVPTTVSPTLNFPKSVREHNLSYNVSNETLISLHLARLGMNEDAVGTFHLSNGAFVADCNVVPCETGHPEAINGRRVMTNYVYADPAAVNALRQSYRSGNIVPMSKHLLNKLPDGLDANILSLADEIFPRARGKGLMAGDAKPTQLSGQQTSRPDGISLDMSAELHPSPSG
jgi:hypothetical protein